MFTGDEILDAWTPDGRPAGKQPRRVIGALGLSTTPPMPAPALPADIIAPSTGPAQGIGGPPAMGGVAPSAPTNLQALSAQDMARISSPAPAVDAGAPPPPSANQASPAGAGEPSPPTKPPPQDVTTAQLRQAGIAGAYNREQGAIEDQATAAQGTAQAEADALIKKAQAEEARNAEVTKILADRSRAANEQLKVVEAKQQALGAARDKWANTKIDRSIDHPVLAAISVALGALGSAMSGRKDGGNPALDALMASIDRKVAGQMQDLDKAGKALGMQKEEIAEMRQLATDKVANYNLMISAETERAARQIEALTSRSNSDIMKAKGTELAAGIRARGAEAFSQAVGKQLETDFRQEQFKQQQLEAKQANAARWAGMAQADRHFNLNREDERYRFDEQMKFNREKALADEQAAINAARAQGDTARAKELFELQKENENRGLIDPTTARRFLTAEGQAEMKKAEALEAEAKAWRAKGAFDVNAQIQAKMREDAAARIRNEAEARHVIRVSPTEKPKVQEILSNTQVAINSIDDIKRLGKEAGKQVAGSSAEAKALRSKLTTLTLTLKDAFQTGALDNGSIEVLNKMTGGDPTKVDINTFTTWLGNSDDTVPQLEALAEDLTRRANVTLRGAGVNTPWKPKRFEEVKPDKLDEAAEKFHASSGSAAQMADFEYRSKHAGNEDQKDLIRDDISNEQSGIYRGLSQTQENMLKPWLSAAKSNDPKIAERGQDGLIGFVTTSSDRNVKIALLDAIRRDQPNIYERALRSVPEDVRKAHFDAVKQSSSQLEEFRRINQRRR